MWEWLSTGVGYVLPAVLVLGVLILIHEFGHFLAARWVGVRVLKFSIGFGPKLLGFRRGETEYVLAAVPFGGFVKMVGEEPGEAGEAEVGSFARQSVGKRALIVSAGPLTNLLGAFVLFAAVFAVYGARVPSDEARVGGLTPGMPAEQAGLREGDLVLAVDGKPVGSWEELSQAIRGSGGRRLVLRVERDGETLEVSLVPREIVEKTVFGESLETKTYVIGIERALEVKTVGPVRAVALAAEQSWLWTRMIVVGLYKIVSGRIPAQEIGGPLEIARQAGKQAERGFEPLLMFMAIISLNLGVLNLLPIPILDGGHLLFLAIEVALRRPVDVRHRELAQQAGLFLLLALMAFAFYNDILRVVQGG
ncbi:MAG: zinc metalloprotease [Candidatus Binatia bacterium]|nr:MAG: zinc metalloprotease [Candidatus Binatia bacterium]